MRHNPSAGVLMRLASTTVIIAGLAWLLGPARAVELAPAVATTVDTVGRWFTRR